MCKEVNNINDCFLEFCLCLQVTCSLCFSSDQTTLVLVFLGTSKDPRCLLCPVPRHCKPLLLPGHVDIVLSCPLCMTQVQGETAGLSLNMSHLGINTRLISWSKPLQFPLCYKTMKTGLKNLSIVDRHFPYSQVGKMCCSQEMRRTSFSKYFDTKKMFLLKIHARYCFKNSFN